MIFFRKSFNNFSIFSLSLKHLGSGSQTLVAVEDRSGGPGGATTVRMVDASTLAAASGILTSGSGVVTSVNVSGSHATGILVPTSHHLHHSHLPSHSQQVQQQQQQQQQQASHQQQLHQQQQQQQQQGQQQQQQQHHQQQQQHQQHQQEQQQHQHHVQVWINLSFFVLLKIHIFI